MPKYVGGKLVGRLGNTIHYIFNGRECSRSMPEKVANPKTEKQVAHRIAFAAISKLSSDLKGAHLIGLYKDAQRGKLNTYSLFKNLNKNRYTPNGIDYAHVVVSKGPVTNSNIISIGVNEQRLLSLTFDAQTSPQTVNDRFHLFVYCPDLRKCCPAHPVPRSVGIVEMEIPEEWAGHDLHLYAFIRNAKGWTSDTMYSLIAK